MKNNFFRKSNHLKIIATFVLLLLIVEYACREESAEADMDLILTENTRAIERAMDWYEANKPETLGLRASNGNGNGNNGNGNSGNNGNGNNGNGKGKIQMKVEWKQSFSKKNEKYEIVEADLSTFGMYSFTMPECMEKYEGTNDQRYKQSYTRIVFRTDRKTKETVGFLMTIVPDLEWLEKSKFKPFKEAHYLDKGKHFGGWILYHNLDGSFSNGWVYERGKITHSLKEMDDTPAELELRSSSCYRIDYYWNVWECPYWYMGSEDWYSSFCTQISSSHIGSMTKCYDDGGGGGGHDGGGGDPNNNNGTQLPNPCETGAGGNGSTARRRAN